MKVVKTVGTAIKKQWNPWIWNSFSAFINCL